MSPNTLAKKYLWVRFEIEFTKSSPSLLLKRIGILERQKWLLTTFTYSLRFIQQMLYIKSQRLLKDVQLTILERSFLNSRNFLLYGLTVTFFQRQVTSVPKQSSATSVTHITAEYWRWLKPLPCVPLRQSRHGVSRNGGILMSRGSSSVYRDLIARAIAPFPI